MSVQISKHSIMHSDKKCPAIKAVQILSVRIWKHDILYFEIRIFGKPGTTVYRFVKLSGKRALLEIGLF